MASGALEACSEYGYSGGVIPTHQGPVYELLGGCWIVLGLLGFGGLLFADVSFPVLGSKVAEINWAFKTVDCCAIGIEELLHRVVDLDDALAVLGDVFEPR